MSSKTEPLPERTSFTADTPEKFDVALKNSGVIPFLSETGGRFLLYIPEGYRGWDRREVVLFKQVTAQDRGYMLICLEEPIRTFRPGTRLSQRLSHIGPNGDVWLQPKCGFWNDGRLVFTTKEGWEVKLIADSSGSP